MNKENRLHLTSLSLVLIQKRNHQSIGLEIRLVKCHPTGSRVQLQPKAKPTMCIAWTNKLIWVSHLIKWQVSLDGCQNNDFIWFHSLFKVFFFKKKKMLSTFSHLTSHFENPPKGKWAGEINSSQYKGGCSKQNQNLEVQMPTLVSILPVSIHTYVVPIKRWPHSKGIVKRIFLWTV